MVHTFDFIIWAEKDKEIYNSLQTAINSGKDEDMIVAGRWHLLLNAADRTVSVLPVDDEDSKLIPCRMSYQNLEAMLNDEYERLEPFEWLL